MKKITLLFIALTLYAGNIFAQAFEVPANYTLDTKEDYARYEKDIIAAAKWLIATPLSEQPDKRKEVSKFLVTWYWAAQR